MMNHAGCVCEPKARPAQAPAVQGGAAVAGGAVVTAVMAAQQASRRH
jgi:hypothetical protein